MSCNYLVTAYKPTAVTGALTGNFTSPTDMNLIESKGNSLIVNLVTPEGLKPLVDVSVYGRISLMQLIRPKGESQDLLMFMTARYHLAVVSYDQSSGDLVTRAYGDVKDRVGRPAEGRQLGIVDPECRVIALHLYAGLLKVVPLELDSGQEMKAFNIRLDDLYAVDLKFLHGFDLPTISYLVEEPEGRLLKFLSISVREKDKEGCSLKKCAVESQASLLMPLPLPLGGVVVIGYETISYYSQSVQHAIDPPAVKESVISCMNLVDKSRCLLGDANGRLLMLFVESEAKMGEECERVTGMKLEVLGEVVSPSSLAYLDNGVVFVGSTFGDSQLVKLSTEADESGSYVQVLENFTNIGAIMDMSVVDLDKQGQDVIVSCSGHGKDGSLRVVRSGIGINEAASIDLPGIKGVWSLETGVSGGGLDNCLVVSFVGQTTFLSLCGEEVEETEIPGLVADQQTYHCGNIGGKRIVQITSQSVRLVDEETMKLICHWEPPSGKNISTVSSNSQQVVAAVGSELFYLELHRDSIQQISQAVMEHEVACVDVTPLGEEGCGRSDLCTIGLWTDISVRLLRLPSLEVLHTQPLAGDIIPRSVLMVTFANTHYLLCALGDGCLIYFQLDPTTGQLSMSKRVILGTKPIVLKVFKSSGSKQTSVFACSNHPTIIYSSNQKLLFSNVNLKEVNYLCTLNSEAFKDSLALVDDSTLTIGSVDDIQMLHIQTIPLGETPRRIAYQESSLTFLVASCRIDAATSGSFVPTRPSVSTSLGNTTVGVAPDGVTTPTTDSSGEVDVFSLLLIDQNSFEVVHSYQLCPREHALSVTSCPLGGSESDPHAVYYIVGTAFVDPTSKEPNQGRVLVLEVTEGRTLKLIHELLKEGAVYQVVPFNGRLVVSVNSHVCVLSWSEEQLSLSEDCRHTNNILSLYVKTKGDFILVGDLMRSLKLLRYKTEGTKISLEDIAMDINMNPVFLSAIEMVDDENYIGADGRHVFVCQKNSEATVEEDLRYMLQPSRIYIGDSINVFGRGSLVMEHPGSGPAPIQGKPLLYGTVHGSIGLICQLSVETFTLLSKVQDRMAKVVKSVGNIEHEVYRSFANDHKTKVTEGFIDGDLIERFLDLPSSQMDDIVKGLKMLDHQGQESDVQLEDVVKLVEDLSRLH